MDVCRRMLITHRQLSIFAMSRRKRGDIANMDVCRRMLITHRQLSIFAMSPFSPATLPTPTLLRGESLTPWPGPGQARPSPCPACGDEPLRPHEYCLLCDRWRLDALLPRVPPPRPRRPYVPSVPDLNPRARQDQSQAERERLRRKARRKAKQKARIEAERFRKQQGEGQLGPKRPAPGTTQAEGPKPGCE
jgi:hypothetical protein